MASPAKQEYKLPSNAVWFVTGCSSGIGRALATTIATKGDRLIATARSVSSLAYLPTTPNILPLALDVTSPASINAALDAALAHFHRIDVFVNNAGYSLTGDTENATDDAARRCLDTDFWGTVDITKRALGILRDTNAASGGQQGGVVANVTSLGGRIGFPGSAFYHAAKFAVEGFTEAVAKEIRPEWNVHFMLIEPGGVKTDFAGRSTVAIAPHPAYAAPDSPARVLERYMADPVASSAWADPEDIAEAVYEVVARGRGIPLRLPLGPETWGLLKAENERMVGLLEESRELAHRVGKAGQLESVKFLEEQHRGL
ncbi:short-chain dehydrogenase/reductase-like protein SDR [Podospora appendiculata]|uniref:Short-chain dehydrogenase/reductase-like protein SDR n=1 Tax=Podospora appendiculata TaxID=314037 RepID=A0AAE1CBR6_9PEZI|nr:short-chain dehydrogenase/reductase-like protein SDR [Podospora appendiculata]